MAQSAFERMIRLARTQSSGHRVVEAKSTTGKPRQFDVYVRGDDLFLLQRKSKSHSSVEERVHAESSCRPVMLIQRRDLYTKKRRGILFVLGTEHFGTVLVPLLSGVFGRDLCRVPKSRCSELLQRKVVLGNVTRSGIELLQRDTDFTLLCEADRWLQEQGIGQDKIIFFERTPEAMDYAERLGQAWRVRPRTRSTQEKLGVVDRSRQQMETCAWYFVSIRGVHWLSYSEFIRLVDLAKTEPEKVRECLHEWVALPPGMKVSNMRQPKGQGLHVIEFLGVSRADAERLLIPSLERLLEGLTLERMTQEDMADTLAGIGRLFLCLMEKPHLVSSAEDRIKLALYKKIVDASSEESDRSDFDARRIALPGATFHDGVPTWHPKVNRQTEMIIDHLMGRLSLNEHIDYINVYDVQSSKGFTSAKSQSREIVMKTNRMPVPISYIQKRLRSVRAGYADYLLTRANVFRALGANYPVFQLLPIILNGKRYKEPPYFLRTRCPGDPLESIPLEFFRSDPDDPESSENPDVVLALIRLYGVAAAQNLVVKKYRSEGGGTCRFGIGKEIFEFVYDSFLHRQMPAHVQVCSIRGTMGWLNLSKDSVNLREIHRFYLNTYAAVVSDYWHRHTDVCTLNECASAFFDGFERKLEAMHWAYQRSKAYFDSFAPKLRPVHKFRLKLDFALWALERSAKDSPALREHFMDYVRDSFIKA